jgi:hypothetical protein
MVKIGCIEQSRFGTDRDSAAQQQQKEEYKSPTETPSYIWLTCEISNVIKFERISTGASSG